ncbi:unnamed protein product, partial [Ixodes hexagonus]
LLRFADPDHPYAAKKLVEVASHQNTPSPDVSSDSRDSLQSKNDSLAQRNKELETRLEAVEKLLDAQKVKTGLLQQTILQKNFRKNLSASVLVKDEKCLKYYTGFGSRDRFQKFLKLIKSRTGGCETPSGRTGRPTSLSFEDQMVVALCRLRLGLFEEDLGFRFQVSVSTISRAFCVWSTLLGELMEEFSVWPVPTAVLEVLPEALRPLPTMTEEVSLECGDILLQVATEGNVLGEVNVVAPAKRPRTAKALIGIAENGYVCFVSDLTPISVDAASPGSGGSGQEEAAVTACSGFEAADFRNEGGAALQESGEEEAMRMPANVRAHIHKVVQEVKRFKILKHMPMCGKLNATWKLCCYLTNFTRDSAQAS